MTMGTSRLRSSGRHGGRRHLVWLPVAVLALVLPACGDDDNAAAPPTSGGSAGTTVAVANDVDPEGVLRIGASLAGAGGLDLDPVKLVSSGNHQFVYPIYGSLLQRA